LSEGLSTALDDAHYRQVVVVGTQA
jgi:hypothetical protein